MMFPSLFLADNRKDRSSSIETWEVVDKAALAGLGGEIMQVLCCFVHAGRFNVPARHTVGNIESSVWKRGLV